MIRILVLACVLVASPALAQPQPTDAELMDAYRVCFPHKDITDKTLAAPGYWQPGWEHCDDIQAEINARQRTSEPFPASPSTDSGAQQKTRDLVKRLRK